jgi:hypothetical protein
MRWHKLLEKPAGCTIMLYTIFVTIFPVTTRPKMMKVALCFSALVACGNGFSFSGRSAARRSTQLRSGEEGQQVGVQHTNYAKLRRGSC